MSYTRGEKERRIMEKSGILKNKLFLYLTEFFAGMSVMAVELGASRLLAPYFSSSQIVWTIIIGTIMIAMALRDFALKNKNPCSACEFQAKQGISIWGIKLLFFSV